MIEAAANFATQTEPGSRPPRIALISAGEIYGGIERFLSTFSARLLAGGSGEPLVVLFSDGPLARDLRRAGVPTVISPISVKYDPRAVRWLASLLRTERTDVVHAHGYKAGVIGGLAARLAGVPAVKTEHGALEPFSGWGALKMRANMALDGLVTASCFEETVYITRELSISKALRGRRGARVIPNGIAPIERTARRRASAAEPFRIGVVGRLSPVKGHATLFSACRLARRRADIRVDVFGSGPLESGLRQDADRQLPGAVAFHGFIDDTVEAMAGLDCLAMPSLHEGLPYTLLEAMHLGLPIIASNVGGMREALEDRRSALLAPAGDSAAFAERIDTLADQPALAAGLGAAARTVARERYGIDAMVDGYLRLYREVMG